MLTGPRLLTSTSFTAKLSFIAVIAHNCKTNAVGKQDSG